MQHKDSEIKHLTAQLSAKDTELHLKTSELRHIQSQLASKDAVIKSKEAELRKALETIQLLQEILRDDKEAVSVQMRAIAISLTFNFSKFV